MILFVSLMCLFFSSFFLSAYVCSMHVHHVYIYIYTRTVKIVVYALLGNDETDLLINGSMDLVFGDCLLADMS